MVIAILEGEAGDSIIGFVVEGDVEEKAVYMLHVNRYLGGGATENVQ